MSVVLCVWLRAPARPDGVRTLRAPSPAQIEGGDVYVDVQYWFEATPKRFHAATFTVDAFHLDVYPATCAEYAAYVAASGYAPSDAHNYLKNWANGSYPPGYAKKPVTYISAAEGRAFCAWQGKRLPLSYEWQYAAQGGDSTRVYPWGDAPTQANYPVQSHARTIPGPEDVDAHAPGGCSPFGVCDLVGNVWQMTDAFQDEHTTSMLVRGSANYRPDGSGWYFRNALELNKHNKCARAQQRRV